MKHFLELGNGINKHIRDENSESLMNYVLKVAHFRKFFTLAQTSKKVPNHSP
jgi:hypothetical protein